jgi:hypothetical protein
MIRRRHKDERGAVAVVVAIVLAFVLVPVTALATGTYVRSTTESELQHSADSGSLAAAASIPLGDVNFLVNYLNATSGSETLQQLGLTYDQPDPLAVACDVAVSNATAGTALGKQYADAPTCTARYLGDLNTFVALKSCATSLQQALGGPLGIGAIATLVPSLAGLLPALLYPGVKVHMGWHVTGPMDKVFGNVAGDKTQAVDSIARRRFKNVVVLPVATVPGSGTTINLNPAAGDTRTTVLNVMTQEESLLRSTPATAPCADVLVAARDDILDIVDPPGTGPDALTLLEDAFSSHSPILTLVYGTTIPFLDFVPVCVDAAGSGSGFVGHTGNFGSCSVDAPGGFRASLRNS